VQLIEGRLPDDRDGPDATPVLVVNETMARRFWPDGGALGHRIRIMSSTNPWRTIASVVRDVRERGYEPAQKPGVYLPYAQAPDTWAIPEFLIVRTAGDPLNLAAAARRVVAAVDPAQPVSAVQSLDAIVDVDVADRRQQMALLGAFAALAVLLAAIGIYGMLSYGVAQRRREIGLRMALGASSASVMRLVVGRGLVLTAIGIAAGVAGGWGATRMMSTLLYGVTPGDPATFAIVTALLGLVGLVACALPALRATRVSPLQILRED
jgi:putative ABC transport system permease protein